MCGSRGGTGGPDPPPPEKSQKYSFIAILGRIRWKSTRLPSQHSMLGHHRHASETRHIVVFGSSLLSLTKKKRCQSWTPSGKTFWIRAWNRVASPLFAYRIMVYQNLNKKWKMPPNETSCQISAVHGQLHESAKTSMCSTRIFSVKL